MKGSLGMYLTEKEYRKMMKAKAKKLADKNIKNKKKKAGGRKNVCGTK
jgi:hypothetical protein